MTYRYSTLIIGALFSLFSSSLNAQEFHLVIDSLEAQPGQNVCVPIRTKEYIEIAFLQFLLTWDPQELTITGTKNYNLPGWSANDFNYSHPNHLMAGWSNPAGECISRDSGAILLEVCFIAIGPSGSSTNITIDTGEAGICSGVFGIVPLGQDTGAIIILSQSGTFDELQNNATPFQISPNPTPASTQVVFQSAKPETTLLLVSDALGRIVFQQKITLIAGENRIEIPAKALNIKGLYQVVLKTEQGVSSQMLSVN